jgi:hypothetical protein
LSWKEILSLIDDYYKVNYFLVERMSWYLRIIYYLKRCTMLCLGMSSVKISLAGEREDGDQETSRDQVCMSESTRWRTRTTYDTMSICLRRATLMACVPELGRTHVWVGMYQFESNRVRLGPNQVGFGPGLCPGRHNLFKYPWGAPSIRLDYVKLKTPPRSTE